MAEKLTPDSKDLRGKPLFAIRGLPARPLLKTGPRANGDNDPSENFNNKPADRSVKPKENEHLQDVQQLKEEQKMEITYHEEKGYLIPNIVIG